MSLPSGFLDEIRNRLSLAQVAGRKVIWDSKKTNQAKGDYWSPCPFHQEKTPSFHVDDRKGYYYCFGCQEKGDMIGFVMGTENVGFMEAVEILAGEAGLQMPARDPRAQEKIDRNKELTDVMEQAVQFFKLQYATKPAIAAREYLRGRGMPVELQEKFEIGFAPNGRDTLYQHLKGKGVKEDKIIEAGLAGKPDDGRAPYDRFRNRIIYPIRDARGRAIAFGGRAMDPNDHAKYLNSPDTPLFDKGRTLYNLAPAREAAGKADQLIVAEGYMDVIALTQYGFGQAVAPLGTAITENQLHMLWRIHPEPIIMLDGDTAGLRAAMRLIDLSLPLLEVGKSLRFCLMPDGMDPDDFLKERGKDALQSLLSTAEPMVAMLWRRETEGKVLDSPERRAALDKALRDAILQIKDKSLRSHYGSAVAALRRELFEPRARTAPARGRTPYRVPDGPSANLKASAFANSEEAATRLREQVILAASLLAPSAVQKRLTQFEKLNFRNEDLQIILNSLLDHLEGALDEDDPAEKLRHDIGGKLGMDSLDTLFSVKAIAIHPHLQATSEVSLIERTLDEELAKLAALKGAAAEIAEAEQDMDGLVDEGLTWRLEQAAMARTKATRAIEDDHEASDENDQDLSNALQKMIDDQIWVKKKN